MHISRAHLTKSSTQFFLQLNLAEGTGKNSGGPVKIFTKLTHWQDFVQSNFPFYLPPLKPFLVIHFVLLGTLYSSELLSTYI